MAEKSSNELADTRTDLAEDRTILANERTFAGWVRTGLAAVGIGVAFQALFREIEPAWVAKAMASAILAAAIVIFVTSERRACAVIERLKTHEVKTVQRRNIRLVSGAMVATTLALIAAIWWLA